MYFAHTNQIGHCGKPRGDDRNLPNGTRAAAQKGALRSQPITSSHRCSSRSARPVQDPQEAAMFIDYFHNSVEVNEGFMAERGRTDFHRRSPRLSSPG